MRDAIVAGALLGALHGFTVPVSAEPTKGYYTMDAMGCMLVQECKKDVERVKNLDQFRKLDPDRNWHLIEEEFNDMLNALEKVGSNVYLADEKYFPVGHRGVYHTVSNHFYLNKTYVKRPGILMRVMRHEGWHAAQDCMAGSIKNNFIAIIHNEEDVPGLWRSMVEKTYPPSAVPWEAEAKWAGHTDGMTQRALQSCAAGTMWTDYELTPMTREWLIENGHIAK